MKLRRVSGLAFQREPKDFLYDQDHHLKRRIEMNDDCKALKIGTKLTDEPKILRFYMNYCDILSKSVAIRGEYESLDNEYKELVRIAINDHELYPHDFVKLELADKELELKKQLVEVTREFVDHLKKVLSQELNEHTPTKGSA